MKSLLAFLTIAALLPAQDAKPAAVAGVPAECSPGRLRMTAVEPREAPLGGTIAIRLDGLNECLTAWPSPEFVLHLSGVPMPALKPILPAAGDNRLQFALPVMAASRPAWNQVFAASAAGSAVQEEWRTRMLTIAVSPGPGQRPYPSAVAGFGLRLLGDLQWRLWLGIAFLLLVLLAWVATSSNALRDSSPPIAAAGVKPPFSLARCQMAAWFYVVLCAYVLIWMSSGLQPALTASTLALIGISAGTGLFAAAVDTTKRNANLEKAAALERQLQEVQGADERLKGELAEVLAQLAPARSEGFFIDILSDANGLSFHRVQMLVWTLTTILIFVWTVFASLVMPEFDATVLGLMGISSGTYLGFKFPEQSAPAPPR
ncbi:MAG TPA: hypothetical protein DEH78_25410 [Solibacterales bacterium]|nr:hypothetical protein [Bryobacterales bacterium]